MSRRRKLKDVCTLLLFITATRQLPHWWTAPTVVRVRKR